MATHIRLGRRIPATKLETLAEDASTTSVAREVAAYLRGRELALVTRDDLAMVLSSTHTEVIAKGLGEWFEWEWGAAHAGWVRVHHEHGVVAVRDSTDEEPVLVTVEERATYA